MDLTAANLIASILSYAVAISVAAWFLVPAARARSLPDALFLLLFIHAFRHIAMQIFSAADVGGLDAGDTALRAIAYGDLATAVVTLAALWALKRRHRTGIMLAWLATIIGTIDLISASIAGIGDELTKTATDFSWFILAFMVPALWVTAVLALWQLITRRHEPYPDPSTNTLTTQGAHR